MAEHVYTDLHFFCGIGGTKLGTAKARGFTRVITYTLPSEGGASLRAAGFVLVGEAGGGSWLDRARRRDPVQRSLIDEREAPTEKKLLWESRRDA